MRKMTRGLGAVARFVMALVAIGAIVALSIGWSAAWHAAESAAGHVITAAWNFATRASDKEPVDMTVLASEMNAHMPMRLNSDVELVNVRGFPGMLLYNLRYVNLRPEVIDGSRLNDAFLHEVKPTETEKACSTPTTRQYLQDGVTLRYVHHYLDSSYIGQFDVTPLDCGF